jgi:hypothetical protein
MHVNNCPQAEENNFVAFTNANIGFNQGGAAGRLQFGIFVSDCRRSIDNATVFQIHDDMHAACEAEDADATLQQLTKYVQRLRSFAARQKTFPRTFLTSPNRQQSGWGAFTSNRRQHHST